MSVFSMNITEVVRRYRGFIDYLRKERAWLLGLNQGLGQYKQPSSSRCLCPLCSSSDTTPSFQAPMLEFVRCNVCDLVYAVDPFSESDLARFYKDNKRYQEAWARHYEALVKQKARGIELSHEASTILKHTQTRGKCLDIGCSFGMLLYQLKPYFSTVEGVELNTFTSKAGADLFDITIHNKELDALSLEPASYDCIILNQVIEHLFSISDLMASIDRLLKPGGILYINCPFMDSLSMKLFKGHHIHVYSIGHINLLTFESAKQLAARYHFRPISIGTDNSLDIQLNDLLNFFLRRKHFIHRDNLIPFLNLPNQALSFSVSILLNNMNILSKSHWGSYLEIILAKE